MANGHLAPGLGTLLLSRASVFPSEPYGAHISEDHREPSGPPSPGQWASGLCPPQA